MLSTRFFALFLLALLVLAPPQTRASDPLPVPLGPLFQEFELTLDPGQRVEVLGPLYYYQASGEPGNVNQTWAWPPVFSYYRNADLDTAGFDFLWKGMSYHRYGDERRFAVLELLSLAGGQNQAGNEARRFTLFPFYFQQRSAVPEKNYTALLPIYGHIRQRLFRDEIKFVMFPVYGQSRKRDVVTDNYLFPFFHLRHGDALKGWQFWPLVGAEHRELTASTNSWGDVEVKGGHEKFFALWPVFLSQRSGLGTTNSSREQALLPFYSFLRSPQRDSTSYFWPLGVTHTLDREKDYEEWGAPWPLVVFAHGSGKTTRRVWPFFSRSSNAHQTSSWWAWPVYKYNRLHSDPLDRERTRILFFLYSDVSVRNTETGRRLRQIDLWPLFTWRKDLEGKARLQILSPLEPLVPNNSSVERDLSPLWSFWRSERNPATGATSQSLLWNLYRNESAHGVRKCSLLFGCFQYQSGPEGSRWRLFHLPVGGTGGTGGAKHPPAPAQAPPRG